MKIDIMTLFPHIFPPVLEESILGRGMKKGLFSIDYHNIRDYTADKHRRVDDYPYGGAQGMIMQADPIFRCYEAICQGAKPHFIYLSPKGKVLTQKRALELSKLPSMILLCGHYEGVDQRLLDELEPEELSIGDFVLTGGELPAMVLCDAVCRLIPGVLSEEECFTEESHFAGLLEHDQYTRPEIWRDRQVPPVLLSGHHANVIKWKRQNALLRTKERRPDLFEKIILSKEDEKALDAPFE